jgi:SAM-dependent methyltransferase
MISPDLFEAEYQRMKREGVGAWFQRGQSWAIDPFDQHFLEDLLAQRWAPKGASVVEFGCGTGPLLRWVCEKGFRGLGIDVSETAIDVARGETADPGVRYAVGDVCDPAGGPFGRHALCLDGRLSHFIVDTTKRAVFFENVRRSLRPDGIFVLMAMCGPIDTEGFECLYPGQRLMEDIIYVPTEADWIGLSLVGIDGRRYFAQSFVPHWQALLGELEREGFEPTLVRFNRAGEGEPVSSLNVAARLKPAAR